MKNSRQAVDHKEKVNWRDTQGCEVRTFLTEVQRTRKVGWEIERSE